jgi:hypothetical protein
VAFSGLAVVCVFPRIRLFSVARSVGLQLCSASRCHKDTTDAIVLYKLNGIIDCRRTSPVLVNHVSAERAAMEHHIRLSIKDVCPQHRYLAMLQCLKPITRISNCDSQKQIAVLYFTAFDECNGKARLLRHLGLPPVTEHSVLGTCYS